MLKLSKKTEYALMAMKHIALNQNRNCISAKEISDDYDIPYELLSKILQSLSKNNIILSTQGVKGGYSISKIPDDISLSEIIKAVEPNYHIVECFDEKDNSKECSLFDCCQIKNPLAKLQKEIDNLFQTTTLSNII